MKLKRILAGALATTTLLSFGLMAGCSKEKEDQAFINDIGGVSETYKGSTSTAEYKTNNQAAEAYVLTEVVGSKSATVKDAVSKGTVDKKKLNLSAEDAEGVESVEEMEVTYEEVSGGIAMVAASASNTKTVTVYIIKYADHFKYYTPCPETGDTITKSYYDSVFNAEAYKNCTLESTATVDVTMTSSYAAGSVTVDMDMGMTMEMTQFIQFTENAIYLETSTTVSESMAMDSESTADVDIVKITAYIEQTTVEGEKVLVCYVKDEDDGTWTKVTNLYAIGFSSLEELAPFSSQYLDYTYFTKTNFGFELSDENAQQYISETFGELLEEILTDDSSAKAKLDMYAKYYVSEGVLSGMRMDMDMSVSASESGATGSVTAKANTVTKVTKRGETTVTKPTGIQ